MPNIMAFKILDGGDFLEFGVSNVEYLAFDTLDENALRDLKTIYIQQEKKNSKLQSILAFATKLLVKFPPKFLNQNKRETQFFFPILSLPLYIYIEIT